MLRSLYLVVSVLMIFFVSACKTETTPQATEVPGKLETQVAVEVAAQLTQIAANQPTASMPAAPETEVPLPTNTPLPTADPIPASPTTTPQNPTNTAPTASPTLRPTATATPAPFACKILKQVPENGKSFKPDADFDVVWTVKNVGTAIWDNNEVDYKYESGDKFYQNEVYDLQKSVKPDESFDLIVDMKAPGDEGDYDTTWVLHRGSHIICTLKVEITVEK